MRILIISNSRCGSTNLMHSISSAYSIKSVFEPFLTKSEFDLNEDMVMKTLINQNSDEEYVKLIPHFHKTIFLSRHDTHSMAESLIDMVEKTKYPGFKMSDGLHSVPYRFEYDGDVKNHRLYEIVHKRKERLLNLADYFNTPVDYYEDVFYKNKTLTDREIKLDLSYLDNNLKLRIE